MNTRNPNQTQSNFGVRSDFAHLEVRPALTERKFSIDTKNVEERSFNRYHDLVLSSQRDFLPKQVSNTVQLNQPKFVNPLSMASSARHKDLSQAALNV